MRAAAHLAVVAALALGGGCRRDEAPQAVTPSTPDAPLAGPVVTETTAVSDSVLIGDPPTLVPGPLRQPPADWTIRTTTVGRGTGVATLTAVRAAAHDGFDRVVFEMTPGVAGYHVEYVDRPAYTCGSGEAVYLPGDAWLLVRLQPARGHDEAGAATIRERRRTFGLPNLQEAALTCDFEADVSWVLGLAAPNGYRMAELADPPRLVIDLRH